MADARTLGIGRWGSRCRGDVDWFWIVAACDPKVEAAEDPVKRDRLPGGRKWRRCPNPDGAAIGPHSPQTMRWANAVLPSRAIVSLVRKLPLPRAGGSSRCSMI